MTTPAGCLSGPARWLGPLPPWATDAPGRLPRDCPQPTVPAVAALLENRQALAVLRRALPRGGPFLIGCRTLPALWKALTTRLVDVLVLTPQPGTLEALRDVRAAFPEIPVLGLAPFRPDDGELILACQRLKMAAVAVEGVDEPFLSE